MQLKHVYLQASMKVFAAAPSADKYHYFRGSDYDKERKTILERYKYINNPNGNSAECQQFT